MAQSKMPQEKGGRETERARWISLGVKDLVRSGTHRAQELR